MILGIEASNIMAGGGLIHLKEFLHHARPEDHGFQRVIVWASQQTLDQLPDRPWLEKSSHPWLNGSLPLRMLWLIFVFPKVAKHTIDILFSPGATGVSFSPSVTMCQNLLLFDSKERRLFGYSWIRFRLKILYYTQAAAFRKSDGVIFLTPSSINYVQEKGINIAHKARVIPHGIDKAFHRNVNRDFLPGKIKIVYVSIVDMYKHQWNVAEAVLRLNRMGYPLELALVGGYYPPAMKKLNAVLASYPDYANKVTYWPAVSHEDLKNTYYQADIFVFASSCETFSLVLLEAMAAGLPIACADRDTLKDTLGDAGMYFDPYDVTTLVTALEKLINDNSLRKTMSKRAYEKSLAYSWSVCADDTLRYLSSLATKQR